MKREIVRLYLDYIVGFSSLGGFAEYYHISIDKARHLVNLGHKLYLKGV